MCLYPLRISVKDKDTGALVVRTVSCGKCIECRSQYSQEWAYRCMLEAKKYERNCFITLTYNDDNLPAGASLCKRDLQLFFKRLRKRLKNQKIRYFCCGEYGAKYDRPHYHIVLFGYDFDDKYFFKKDNKGNSLFRSPLLESVWTFGFSSIGEISYDTAKYCAKYLVVDNNYLPKDKVPPFTLMSRRPGIALDVIPKTVYSDGVIYYEGKRVRAPRAFLRVLKNEFPEIYELIRYKTAPFSERLKIQYFNTDKYVYYLNDYMCDIECAPSDLRNYYEQRLSDFYDSCWHDYSLQDLFLYAREQEEEEKRQKLELRRAKIKKIFGFNLDNKFRLMIKFKSKKF